MKKTFFLFSFLFGICYADVATIYPDANPETSSTDGGVYRAGIDQTFADIIAGAGTSATPTNATGNIWVQASTTSNQFGWIFKSGFTFDLTALSGTIDDATLSLFDRDGFLDETLAGDPDIDIVSFSPDTNTDIIASDYADFGATVYSSLDLGDMTGGTYHNFVLNASGETYIEEAFGSVVGLGAQLDWVTDGAFGGVWDSGQMSGCGLYYADQALTTSDPKLVINYTPAGGERRIFITQ